MKQLNELETAVLDKMLAGDHADLGYLRTQIRSLRGVERELSGAGFFTKFILSEHAEPLPDNPTFRLDDVIANIDGLKNGAGFILLVESGNIRELEGFSYDEPWPSEVRTFSVSYVSGGRRDMSEFERELNKEKAIKRTKKY